MILIFFGPPGAGKGTQAKFISEKFLITHLSTGDILRDKLSENSDLSKEVKEIIDKGKLVSDSILNTIVSERLIKEDCQKGFLLDGYPRTIQQSIFLEEFLAKKKLKINYVVDFLIDEKTIIKRIKSRALIEGREDDNEQVIKTRISKYDKETKPVCNFYAKKYPDQYLSIDGSLEIDNLNKLLEKSLKNPLN